LQENLTYVELGMISGRSEIERMEFEWKKFYEINLNKEGDTNE
jgi:hypothetical protein